MKFSAIVKKLHSLVASPTGPHTRKVAGVDVETYYFPEQHTTAIYVLGEKFESVDEAARIIYAYQV